MSTFIRQAWLTLPMALVMIAGCGGKQKMGCGFFTSFSIPTNEQNTDTQSSHT